MSFVIQLSACSATILESIITSLLVPLFGKFSIFGDALPLFIHLTQPIFFVLVETPVLLLCDTIASPLETPVLLP